MHKNSLHLHKEPFCTSCCFLDCSLFVFQLFNRKGGGSLSERELSDLMEALVGIPQHRIAELYAAASDENRLTEGENQLNSVDELQKNKFPSRTRAVSECLLLDSSKNHPCCGFVSTESLLRVLTAHPTFQKVTKEYLRPEEAAGTLSNGRSVNNNGSVYNNSKKSE